MLKEHEVELAGSSSLLRCLMLIPLWNILMLAIGTVTGNKARAVSELDSHMD